LTQGHVIIFLKKYELLGFLRLQVNFQTENNYLGYYGCLRNLKDAKNKV